MTSYEGLREDRASETTTTVPTLAQRNGDFSQTFAQNGQLIRIFDPVHDPAESGGQRLHPRPVPEQRHPGRPHGSGRAPGPQLLPAAESAGQRRHRRAELLRDRHRRAERRQLRRARRPQHLGQGRSRSSATRTARRSARRRRSSPRTSPSPKAASTSRTSRTTPSSTTAGRCRTPR